MAFEKSKILKNAEKFVASGKISQAIDEYLKILKENPKDWHLMIQIGDLLLKVNRNEEAIENFQTVADHYYSDGFFLKAIAIYKRINKLNPNLIDICTRLADLYLKQGLTMDAKSQLHIVAQHYLSKNQNKEAIETLQRLIEIEPDNLKNRNELAKAYKNEGMIPEAIQEYLRITEELTKKNLFKECLAVLETAQKLDPGNSEVLKKLMELYQQQGEPQKGFALLEEALKSNPADSEILSLLAGAYASKNQYSKAHDLMDRALQNAGNKEPLWEIKGDLYLKASDLDAAYDQYNLVVEKEIQRKDVDRAVFLMQRITESDSVHQKGWQRLAELYGMLRQQANLISALGNLAEAYISKSRYEEAAEALEKLVKLDPEDHQHKEKLKLVHSKFKQAGPAEKPEKMYEIEPDSRQQHDYASSNPGSESLNRFSAFQPQTESVPVQRISQPVAAKSTSPAISNLSIVTAEEKEFVSEHLIEAEVFNKYGLIDKAIEQLNLIISKYPHSVPTHQKLKEIFLEKGERDRAVEQCIEMSRIFRNQGDLDQAEDLLSEARQINPNHTGLDRAYKELSTGIPEPQIAPEIPTQPVPPSTPEQHQELKRSSAPLRRTEKKTARIEIPGLEKLGSPATAPKVRTTEKQKTADVTAAKARAALSELEKFAQQIKTQSGTFKVKPAASKQSQPAQPADNKPAEPVTTPEDVLEIEIEIEEPEATPTAALPASEFEEIDFFMDQGLLEDARNALKSLQEKYPGDSGVAGRLERIEKSLSTPPEQPVPSGDMELPVIDLSATDFGGPADSSEEIVISMDDEFERPAANSNMQAQEPKPELQLSMGDTQEPAEAENYEGRIEPPQKAKIFADVQEPDFTEFGELEDSTEAGLKPPLDDRSFEESFSDAVDAVFQVAEQGAEKPEDSSETIIKDELFEEEEDFFDLAAELEEGLLNVQSAVEEDRPPDGQNYSIEDILSDFKKGVDKQLGSEDYDTRYNLGIAYKEMGLIDEAIAEFQIAAKDPKRFLECCSMLGLCFVEKGMHKLAVKWYQRGLDSTGYTEEEYQGLRFDLAQAYESMGETDRALEIFQEVYGFSANYRNVAKKVKELQERKNH
jgi:tetratricopeptide (TPR) repeat protein